MPAEAVARDLPRVSLDDALRLVYLYAEKESPKFEPAALKWLRRYLDEKSPTLNNFAKVVRSLDERQQSEWHGGVGAKVGADGEACRQR